MNFSTTPLPQPPVMAPCLAVITLGSDGPRHSAMMGLGVDASATDRVEIGQNIRTVFWRARVGVSKDALIIAPLETPPNPVLSSRPVATEDAKQFPILPEHDTSTLAGRIAHLLHQDSHPVKAPKPVTDAPGVIDGRPLAGISVPIAVLDRRHLLVSTKNKETYVQIPVGSDDPLKQATLSFEFDDWLSAKADAEILGTNLQLALDGAEPTAAPAGSAAPAAPAQNGAAAPAAQLGPELTPQRTQDGLRVGRDNDGSTHPSGDGEYKHGWQDAMRGKW